jgi:hypothetical protein
MAGESTAAPTVDLIVTSRGGDRLGAFAALVASLGICRGFGGRLIVVDQSADGSVGRLAVGAFGSRAVVIPSAPCSLSHARNLAKPVVQAPVVGFPDDDAVYFPDTLDRLAGAFADPGLQVLCGQLVDPHGRGSAGMIRAPTDAIARLSWWGVFQCATSAVLFVRHPGWHFAEDLGAGTWLGAGEDTDLVCRLMAAGGRAAYLPEVRIGHPVVTTRTTPPDKVRSYARGYAAMVRRVFHHTRSPAPLAHLALTLAAGVAGIVRSSGDPVLRAAYRARLTGLMEGLRAPVP